MQQLLSVSIVLAATIVVNAFIPYYHFPIEGHLICKSDAKLNAVVEVWEQDIVTSDDLIAVANVTRNQNFYAIFDHMEIGSVSPYLVIKHNCNSKEMYDYCHTRTIFPITNHHELDLGETVRLRINLMSSKLNHTIVCDSKALYPFQDKPSFY